jgi:hypothetical protein
VPCRCGRFLGGNDKGKRSALIANLLRNIQVELIS